MVNFNEVIEDIRDNRELVENKNDNSFYKIYAISEGKYIQVRISNNGTNLWTWLEKDYDPSNAIDNVSIVFSENGECDSNVLVDLSDKERTFTITQYVYDCRKLNYNDARNINTQIMYIVKNGCFTDPLVDTDKHAKVYKLKPNEELHIIV